MAIRELSQTWGVMSLLLVSLLLVSTDARAGCETDMQCKGDRICMDGECVEPANEPAAPEPSTSAETEEAGAPASSATTGAIRVFSTAPGTVSVDRGSAGQVAREPYELGGLPPGRHKVEIETEDGATASERVLVTAGQTTDIHLAPDRRQNQAAMIAGIVLVPAGAIAVTIGIINLAGGTGEKRGPYPEHWGPLMIGGGAGLIAGVVCLIVGAPLVEADAATATEDVSVEPLIGPTGGGLRVRF